jgi:hypothetical protein
MITTDGPALLLGGSRSWVRIARVPGSPGDRFWRVEGKHPCLHADFVVRLARRDVIGFADALLAGLAQHAARQIGITTEPQNPLTVSLCRCDDETRPESSRAKGAGAGAAVAAFAMITPSGADQSNLLTMELTPQPIARLASALTAFRQALA